MKMIFGRTNELTKRAAHFIHLPALFHALYCIRRGERSQHVICQPIQSKP